MKQYGRFKDEFVVIFEGHKFDCLGISYNIWGMTGIDVDSNIIQIRDDLMVVESLTGTQYSFNKLMNHWTDFHPPLIKLIKTMMLAKIRN